MAKNNHTLGKLLAFTTAAAAIGGACYVFRDKIKQSPIYQKAMDKLSGLMDKDSEDFTDDDFFFDEEDTFSEDSAMDREYTSITMNAKQEEDNGNVSPLPEAEDSDSSADSAGFSTTEESELSATADDTESIPTIPFESSFSTPVSTPEPPTVTETAKPEQTEDAVSGYEYEGLSDVSEDPDVLEEQDRLDF